MITITTIAAIITYIVFRIALTSICACNQQVIKFYSFFNKACSLTDNKFHVVFSWNEAKEKSKLHLLETAIIEGT
jgi:hypothetical protein